VADDEFGGVTCLFPLLLLDDTRLSDSFELGRDLRLIGVRRRFVVMVDGIQWQLYTLRIVCCRWSLRNEAGVTLSYYYTVSRVWAEFVMMCEKVVRW
jgi:hypothetical protein